MNHEDVKLENISKLFEFERIAREIDSCDDVKVLQNICKSYVKLYMKQQETVSTLVKNW